MTSDRQFSPADYLLAFDVVRALSLDLEIHFQMIVDTATREQAVENFTKRQALALVQRLLLEEGERISGA